MKTILLFLTLLLFSIVSCDTKGESPNTNITLVAETKLNLSYGQNSLQVLDLYLPAGRSIEKTKTLILIHGGGWIEGDKSNMNYLVDIIKQNLPDYAIANINYRLATVGNYAFPMQQNDVNAAFLLLKDGDFGISDEFGLIGLSAGGHLSMLHSYTNNPSNSIKMVCSIVGPTNFIDPNYISNPFMTTLFQTAAGVPFASNLGFYEQLSPLYHAKSSAPPTLLLYGRTDPLVPETQGVDLHNKLNQLGVSNELKLFDGGHGDWPINDQIDAYTRMVNFIKLKL